MKSTSAIAASAAVACLALLSATPVYAQQHPSSTTKQSTTKAAATTEHCRDLMKQFDAASTSHVSADKLADAKKQAMHGDNMCASNPKEGIEELDAALRKVGATPK